MNGNKETGGMLFGARFANSFWEGAGMRKKNVFLLALFSLFAFALQAQTIACNGTPAGPLSVAVNGSCNAVLTADNLLEGPVPAGTILIDVYDPLGNLVASGPEPVTVDGGYLGQLMSATVTHEASGNNCTSYFVMHDALAPVFTANCDDVVIGCNADMDPASVGYPTVVDNCDPDVMLTYADVLVGPDCSMAPPYIGQIVRTWYALDDSGNQSQCTQVINLESKDVNDVVFPDDFTYECSDAVDLDPSVTGEPMIDGNSIMSGVYCMINTTYTDNIVYTCLPSLASYEVIRTWTVVDNCTNQVETYDQHITVEDTTAPDITCPDPLIMGTNSATCSADFVLPQATVSDNCTAQNLITVTTTGSWGGSGTGPFFNVPIGAYTVTYQATDLCGNTSFCQVDLTIIDDDVPTAICDEFTVVPIPATGLAVVPASNLDDGSYDNCAPIVFTASRDGGATYGTYLEFDCDDIGQQIEVILRVAEQGNPASYSECDVFVDVQDKSDPLVSCPLPTLTIECDDDYSDLSIYGDPIVLDGCAADVVMVEDSVITINNCGEGTIVRNWTFTDAGGNVTTCQQTITVENQNPYDGSTIVWPENYTLYDACIEQEELHPDSLPDPYSRPQLPSEPCALLGVNYSDQYYYISYPACYKIVRTWAVMDWCSYDPYDPNSGGIWYHTQLIIMKDDTPPVLTVPNDTIVAVDNNCQYGYADLPDAFATDCSPFITITNNSPYATDGGANASGFYPMGTTEVLFTAVDGCGNTTYATMTVEVRDLKLPSIVCNSGIATELGYMPDTISVSVDADMFVAHKEDNCTAEENLQVYMRLADPTASGPPSTKTLTFYCNDIGTHDVEIWVVDEAGNADFCITQVIIQDNFVVCPPSGPAVATIAGLIEDESGVEADGVEVHVTNNNPNDPGLMQMGSPYAFEGLTTGSGYTVTPEKDGDATNGVSTYDLVLITRHILGVDSLDTPYQMLAADANRSGAISTLDMVVIRKVILLLEDDFGGQPSWRFIPADYVFPDPSNPWLEYIPDYITYPELMEDQMHSDFIAIKIGDVDGSAQVNSNIPPVNVHAVANLPLQATDVSLKAGNSYAVAVRANQFEDVAGFQFTLAFDPEVLQLERIEPGVLSNLSTANFGMNRLAQGLLTGSWNKAYGLSLEDESELFILHFKALEDGHLLSDVMELNSDLTKAEAYRSNGERLVLSLEFLYDGEVSEGQVKGLKMQQNIPNPFGEETSIGFYLPKGDAVTLSIFDASGRMVYTESRNLPKGRHEWVVNASQLEGSGVYYYRVKTSTEMATNKMILMK